MKNTILSLTVLLFSSIAFSQSYFSLEYWQDVTPGHIRISETEPNNKFVLGASGVQLAYSFNLSDDFHLEPFIAGTIIADESPLIADGQKEFNPNEIISEDRGDYTDVYYSGVSAKTTHYTFGMNFYRKMSPYFSVGSGLNGTFYKSVFDLAGVSDFMEYSDDRYLLANRLPFFETQTENKIYLAVPIIVRGYFPIGEKFAFRLTAQANLSIRSRIQVGLAACF